MPAATTVSSPSGARAAVLELARRELSVRRDVHTLHAHPWALRSNGQHREAHEQIEQVLALGLRDVEILLHASEIAASAPTTRSGIVLTSRFENVPIGLIGERLPY